MLSQAFALTKIQPPRLRSALIERPSLEHRFGDSLATARLTLLCAPAGYGKTAALTRQLSRLPAGTAAAWVALDEDDELTRVAACLVAALEPFDLPWRSSPDALILAMQDGSRASRHALEAALLNALAATDVPRGLLLFDDVHRITDPTVFEFFDALLERLPAHWGIVMASRTDPPLALARLRAQGDCVEIRQDTLGFEADEVRTLIQTRQANASESAVHEAFERTRGWPAGLGLVLSDSPGRHLAHAGSLRDRHVFDYIASEVLDDMPAELRQFLLRCSVLPELSAERCAAVSGDPRAAQWLEEIERRGLFASVLESDTYTLRLHDLFRDCLDDRLRRDLPAELPELLKRAANTEADPVRRIGHLLRASDWAAATRELSAMAADLLTRGELTLMLRLLAQFPADHMAQSPELQLTRTILAWAHWDWGPMREASVRAVEGFARRGDEAMRQRALSYACVAYSATDDDDQAQVHVDQLLTESLEEDTLCRTLLVATLLALPRDAVQLAETWTRLVTALEHLDRLQMWYECSPIPSYIGLPGMREPLLRYVAGVQRRLPETPIPLSGMIQVTQGWLHLWAGRWNDVSHTIGQAESDCRWLGQPTNLRWQLHMLKAMACALRGDIPGSREASQVLVDEAQALGDRTRRSAYLARLTHYAQRVAVIADDELRFRELSASLEAHRHDPHWFLPPAVRQLAEGYAALSSGDHDAARRLWTGLLDHEMRIDVYGQAIEIRLRLADMLLKAGHLAEAFAMLAPVLARLQDPLDAGMANTAGPQVLARLAAAEWGPHLVDDSLQSLRTWAQAAQSLRAGPVPAAEAWGSKGAKPLVTPSNEPLTPRELDVLQRIAAGDSNKVIARAFDLSPHTVKRHVANILDKLGVASRGMAAAWVREHT